MKKFAFIFPGQGSQFIGMGKELADAFPEAKAVFDEVDAALGQGLSGLMWSGDEEELKLTANTQPALMAVSVAAMRALQSRGVGPEAAAFVAGHSLGEYSALAASGAISVADAARVLRIRGNAMQAAVPAGEGAMAALLGADPDQAVALCELGAAEGGVCEIANDNAPGQIVISGSKAAVELAAFRVSEVGVKKAMMLPVSAPFHCSMMQPAADAMMEALAGIEVKAPATALVANVTAAPTTDPSAIRQQLIEQVTGQVRWRESVEYMVSQGVELFVEAGAGKVLSVMNRRTAKEVEGLTLGTPEDVESVAERLG
ncbi:ACP S-malonyltransferase [Henriciella pelagia]|jgi:[acyl-carrier-protein] S-malonyltransferase|uniref:Malonyl CoA-acyl carrier protein transacylase n=1 Tax=Henriciella pelagia TaxID=1977912 RepID=A0ABQ1J732_9PROT|nr:ACP S-malonyltransferase [Henriciella pelagia]GGB61428.1 malonyl CoA-acyl carrier protein transacylase [Henriciella pelagia]